MRVASEGKLPPADFGPNKDASSPGNNDQRDKLLPIHSHSLPEIW